MIACGNCGKINDDSERLCRSCGTSLIYGTPVAPPPSADSARRDYPPRVHTPPQRQPQMQPRPVTPLPQRMPYAPPVVAPPFNAPFAPSQYGVPPMGNYRCPRCATTQLPRLESKISDAGIITIIVMAVFCFPLFWIGMLMKQQYTTCPVCDLRLG